MSKSCAKCIHKGICKIYHGEMLRRDYKIDFIKQIHALQKELGKECAEYLGDNDEPPSEGDKNSSKLRLSGSRDLYGAIFGCQPLLAGNSSFRSLAWAGHFR